MSDDKPAKPSGKIQGFLENHGNLLWWAHSLWAMTFGVLVMTYGAKDYRFARWTLTLLIPLWLIMVVFYRLFGDGQVGDRKLSRFGFVAMTYGLKNMYQTMLFFLLPFYWKSTTFGSQNQWFIAVLAFCALLATLDIVFDRVLMRWRVISAAYFTVTLFAALNLGLPAVFPVLTAGSAFGIAAATAVLVMALSLVPWRRLREAHFVRPLLGIMAAAGVALWLLKPFVPPVPHYIVNSEVGLGKLIGHRPAIRVTGVHISRLEDLRATTTVFAPGESGDGLIHRWVHNGDEIQRSIAGVVRSGNQDRIQLTSHMKKEDMGDDPTGAWVIEVLTDGDRLIGRLPFDVFP